MGFDLGARPDGDYPHQYYDGPEKYSWPDNEYTRSPSFSAKAARDSALLGDEIIDALVGDITPADAVQLADTIENRIREHSGADPDHLAELAKLAHWLRYWGEQDVPINGGP